MPKLLATESYAPNTYVDEVVEHLKARRLRHLRVRRHADLVIIESGPKGDAIAHARFRRVTKQFWRLEVATHSGAWEPTPWRESLENQLSRLTDEFGWTLEGRA
jgi:hypothetical protein